jgi:hypothetical protein
VTGVQEFLKILVSENRTEPNRTFSVFRVRFDQIKSNSYFGSVWFGSVQILEFQFYYVLYVPVNEIKDLKNFNMEK